MALFSAAAARTCSASSATDPGCRTGIGPQPSMKQEISSICPVYEKSKGFFSGGRRPGFLPDDALGGGGGAKKLSGSAGISKETSFSEILGSAKGFRDPADDDVGHLCPLSPYAERRMMIVPAGKHSPSRIP